MRHVAEIVDMSLEDLNRCFTWPLYKRYGHAFDAFKLALTEPDRVFEGLEVSSELRQELLVNIRKRMTAQPVKIRSGEKLFVPAIVRS